MKLVNVLLRLLGMKAREAEAPWEAGKPPVERQVIQSGPPQALPRREPVREPTRLPMPTQEVKEVDRRPEHQRGSTSFTVSPPAAPFRPPVAPTLWTPSKGTRVATGSSIVPAAPLSLATPTPTPTKSRNVSGITDANLRALNAPERRVLVILPDSAERQGMCKLLREVNRLTVDTGASIGECLIHIQAAEYFLVVAGKEEGEAMGQLLQLQFVIGFKLVCVGFPQEDRGDVYYRPSASAGTAVWMIRNLF